MQKKNLRRFMEAAITSQVNTRSYWEVSAPHRERAEAENKFNRRHYNHPFRRYESREEYPRYGYARPKHRYFVNQYFVERRYGGPEEGGWYYDNFDLIWTKTYPCRYLALKATKRISKRDDCGEKDLHRVHSTGAVITHAEAGRGQSETKRRPYYE